MTAWSRADGSEIRRFDLATPITTSKIRVLIEDGYADGWSYLDEIEAYRTGVGCAPPPQECTADVALDGTASASSTHSSGLYPVTGVNNGRRESGDGMGYWNDNANGTWPDWVQVAWDETADAQQNRRPHPARARGVPARRDHAQKNTDPVLRRRHPRPGSTSPAEQARTTRSSTGRPEKVYDGSESRAFNLATPVTTTKIRALIEDGSTGGWSWMDELEAYPPAAAASRSTPKTSTWR